MINLTEFQQILLLDVAIRERQVGESPHGLAIKEDITQMYRGVGDLDADEEVNHGRLYPNLDVLVEEGLLEKSERDKRTNDYTLTDAGAKAISHLEALIHLAQGKDAANPFVDASSVVSGHAKHRMTAAAESD